MEQLPLTYGSYLRLIKNAPEKFFVNFSGAQLLYRFIIFPQSDSIR